MLPVPGGLKLVPPLPLPPGAGGGPALAGKKNGPLPIPNESGMVQPQRSSDFFDFDLVTETDVSLGFLSSSTGVTSSGGGTSSQPLPVTSPLRLRLTQCLVPSACS